MEIYTTHTCMRGRVSLIFSISDGSSNAFFRSILERMFHQPIVCHQLQVSSFLFRAEYPCYQKYVGSSLQHGEFEIRNKSGKFGRDRVRLESKYFIIEYERVFEPIISDYYRSRPKSTEDSFVRAQNLNSESFEKNDNYSNCFCNDRIEN